MEPGVSESLGVPDPGKWMPFAIHLSSVESIKLTADEREEALYNCTSLFTFGGEVYIIDTPFKEFLKIFLDYHKNLHL